MIFKVNEQTKIVGLMRLTSRRDFALKRPAERIQMRFVAIFWECSN